MGLRLHFFYSTVTLTVASICFVIHFINCSNPCPIGNARRLHGAVPARVLRVALRARLRPGAPGEGRADEGAQRRLQQGEDLQEGAQGQQEVQRHRQGDGETKVRDKTKVNRDFILLEW